MNREEVMAMTDNELDVNAAILMGWKPGYHRGEPCWMQPDYDVPVDSVPYYTSNIADAWELMGPMMQRISTLQMMTIDGNSLSICGWIFDEDGVTVGVLEAIHDDTAPRAITRAFILAMSTKSI